MEWAASRTPSRPPLILSPPSARSALEALLTEAARVRLHGFSDGEFERAVRAMEAQVRGGASGSGSPSPSPRTCCRTMHPSNGEA